jgi:hypothetical protein
MYENLVLRTGVRTSPGASILVIAVFSMYESLSLIIKYGAHAEPIGYLLSRRTGQPPIGDIVGVRRQQLARNDVEISASVKESHWLAGLDDLSLENFDLCRGKVIRELWAGHIEGNYTHRGP